MRQRSRFMLASLAQYLASCLALAVGLRTVAQANQYVAQPIQQDLFDDRLGRDQQEHAEP